MDDGKVPVGRISLPSFLRYLGGEGESKKLNFRIPDPKYLRLFCVNLQKEFLLDKVSDPFKQPFGRFSAFCKENSVIRIADRPNPFAFKLFVKFMQKNVSQQWRDNTSLRGCRWYWAFLLCLLHRSVHAGIYESATQPFHPQSYRTAIG